MRSSRLPAAVMAEAAVDLEDDLITFARRARSKLVLDGLRKANITAASVRMAAKMYRTLAASLDVAADALEEKKGA